jgi:hypothetical protein
MSGVEWANPILLHGRLAVEAARRLYDAETRIGTDRFRRIEGIVLDHTVGSPDATLLEKIFVVADWTAQQDAVRQAPGRDVGAEEPTSTLGPIGCETDVSEAYLRVFERKLSEVRRRGDLVSPSTARLLAGAGRPREPDR